MISNVKILLLALILIALSLANGKSVSSSLQQARTRKDSFKKDHVSSPVKSTTERHSGTLVTLTSASVTAAKPASFGVAQAVRLTTLFLLWYGFNAGYNVFNAYMKKDFQLPWSSATIQLAIGLFYAIPLWFLRIRKIPNISASDLSKLLPIALLNAGGHACTVIAMFEKGGGSFTHVIKASEPVVSVILNLFINRIVPKPFTALSLLPVTYGVAYASTLGNLNVQSMSKEFATKAARFVKYRLSML